MVVIILLLSLGLVYFMINKDFYIDNGPRVPHNTVINPIDCNPIDRNSIKPFNYHKDSEIKTTSTSKVRGICFFDIDGTLTEGNQNHMIVETCLNRGYMVGVITAGAMYNRNNLKTFSWMPNNLYQYMLDRDFATFNNVNDDVVMGQYIPNAFNQIDRENTGSNFYGWRKGYTAVLTAKAYGIEPNDVYIFDDLVDYIHGMKRYDSKLNVICSGRDCKGILNHETVMNALD